MYFNSKGSHNEVTTKLVDIKEENNDTIQSLMPTPGSNDVSNLTNSGCVTNIYYPAS